MTSDVKLLPCPFCGGPAERIDFGSGDAENEGGSCIACTRCQSSGPVEFGNKENFVSNWNRRACIEADRKERADDVARLAEALRLMIGAATPVATEIDARGYAWSEAYLDQALPTAREALAPSPPPSRRPIMTDLVERLRDCAKGCDTYSPDQCATLIDGIGHIAMRHLLREAATALEAQKIQQWYRDALDEIDELLAAAKKSESKIAQLTSALEAAREDVARMDWLDQHAHCAGWDEFQPMKQVVRADDGEEFSADTWREAIDNAIDAARKEVEP